MKTVTYHNTAHKNMNSFKLQQESKDDSGNDELVRRLTNLESIIDKLFAIPNSSFILEKKITQLEEMCADFPDGNSKIGDQWRDKIVDLWQRYSICGARIVASTPSMATPGTNSISSFIPAPGLITSNKKSTQSLKSVAASISKSPISKKEKPIAITPVVPSISKPAILCSPRRALLQTPSSSLIPFSISVGNSSIAPFPWNTPEHGKYVCSSLSTVDETSKQVLRDELEKTFSQLGDIQSGADVDAVKQLLTEVARAQQQISLYGKSDSRLLFDVFNFAFRKLPSKMREQFLTIYGVLRFGINLVNLIAFLQAEIVAQHSKTVWLMSMLPNNTSNKPISMISTLKKAMTPFDHMKVNFVPDNAAAMHGNYCSYCKTAGHVQASCPSIKELLCFQCYQYGHTKKGCTNKPLV